jgi:hypothetical protein
MRRPRPPLPHSGHQRLSGRLSIPLLLSGVALAGLCLLGVAGCDDEHNSPIDREAPAIPRGVTSITGDGEVTIYWYPNMEWDLSGYRVYRNFQASGIYQRIGFVEAAGDDYWPGFVDRNVVNGTTYYYAISAIDREGNESDLSLEAVHDTPRPEGRGLRLSSYQSNPDDCAYDFSRYAVTGYSDPDADVAFIHSADTGDFMVGLNNPDDPQHPDYFTELQDAGYLEMDDVTWAPVEGWSPTAEVELIPGHVYIVWTRNDHYAKFRVLQVGASQVVIDWAYQIAEGNQELKQGAKPRPVHDGARARR